MNAFSMGSDDELTDTDSIEGKINKYQLITRRIDIGKIRHKNRKELEVFSTIAKNLKLNYEGPIRAGVIVYTHHKGKTYFCLGVDSQYGDLTDFGGGVKKDENVIHGGLRELEEESQGIFGKLHYKDVKNSLTFYTFNMVVMFVKLDVDMIQCRRKFTQKVDEYYENTQNRYGIYDIFKTKSISLPNMPIKIPASGLEYSSESDIEVSDIKWLSTEELMECIHGRGKRIYARVRRVLAKVTDTISSL